MCEQPLAVTFHQLERELQVPGMTATSENCCRNTTATCQRSMIAVDFDFRLLMFCRIIVECTVGDCPDVFLLRLVHSRHVSQHKNIGMDTV